MPNNVSEKLKCWILIITVNSKLSASIQRRMEEDRIARLNETRSSYESRRCRSPSR